MLHVITFEASPVLLECMDMRNGCLVWIIGKIARHTATEETIAGAISLADSRVTQSKLLTCQL